MPRASVSRVCAFFVLVDFADFGLFVFHFPPKSATSFCACPPSEMDRGLIIWCLHSFPPNSTQSTTREFAQTGKQEKVRQSPPKSAGILRPTIRTLIPADLHFFPLDTDSLLTARPTWALLFVDGVGFKINGDRETTRKPQANRKHSLKIFSIK